MFYDRLEREVASLFAENRRYGPQRRNAEEQMKVSRADMGAHEMRELKVQCGFKMKKAQGVAVLGIIVSANCCSFCDGIGEGNHACIRGATEHGHLFAQTSVEEHSTYRVWTRPAQQLGVGTDAPRKGLSQRRGVGGTEQRETAPSRICVG